MNDRRIFAAITEEVCQFYKVDFEDLTLPSRKRKYVEPRNVIWYFTDNNTDLSLNELSKPFNRNHTTALAGKRSIANMIKYNGFALKSIQIAAKIEKRIEIINNTPVQYCPHCKQPMP